MKWNNYKYVLLLPLLLTLSACPKSDYGLHPIEDTTPETSSPETKYIFEARDITQTAMRTGNRDRIRIYTVGFQVQFNSNERPIVRFNEHSDELTMSLNQRTAIPDQMGTYEFQNVNYYTPLDRGITILGAIVIATEGKGCTSKFLVDEVLKPGAQFLENQLFDLVATQQNGIIRDPNWQASFKDTIQNAASDLVSSVRVGRALRGCAATMLPLTSRTAFVGSHAYLFFPFGEAQNVLEQGILDGYRLNIEGRENPDIEEREVTMRVIQRDDSMPLDLPDITLTGEEGATIIIESRLSGE